MRLRLAELLEERGMTAYGLHQASDGRLSLSAAYRLAADDWRCLPREVMEVLCDVLGVGPGELLEYVPEKRRGSR